MFFWSSADFFSKSKFPSECQNVRPDLDPNCLQKLSADDARRQRVNHQVSYADNLCKLFGPRSGPTKNWACSRSNFFNALVVFLKEFWIQLILKKVKTQQRNHEKSS